MKNRKLYLNKLIEFKDKTPIKVITGIRRSGKSTLLNLFSQYLQENGVKPRQIIYINFESLDFEEIKTYDDLNTYIKKQLLLDQQNYILLDEIQVVSEWERAVNSLRLLKNTDIYITGSNAHMLSSELSTLLAGRYIEIKILPLSFKEYLQFYDVAPNSDLRREFASYMRYGGFPGLAEFAKNEKAKKVLLSSIYDTILMRDVIMKNEIRNPALLENLVRFLCANIGNIISVKKISDYLTSSGRKTTADTIENYLRALESAYIFYRVRRFDIKGKMHLKTLEKFYPADTGLRNELMGFRDRDYGFNLENIVFFELLRKGYDVSIGKIGNMEIDFIASSADSIIYYQVTESMKNEETRKRELAPFDSVSDHYEKVVLSMDDHTVTDFAGVKNINIIDFLLS